MNIALSTPIFDLNGARYLKDKNLLPQSGNNTRTRRMSRTSTLDGGVAISDTGYSAGDRDITVSLYSASKDISEYFAYLTANYNEIIISTDEAIFRGVPAEFKIDSGGAATLTIKIISDLTA